MATIDDINVLEQSGQITPDTAERLRRRVADQQRIGVTSGNAPVKSVDVVPQQTLTEQAALQGMQQNNEANQQQIQAPQEEDIFLDTTDVNVDESIKTEDEKKADQQKLKQVEKDVKNIIPKESDVQKRQQDMRSQLASAEAADRELIKQNAIDLNKQEQAAKQLDDEDRQMSLIDPKRFWKNLSTGDKVLAGISIALSGIGAALTGSKQNQALNIIENAINQDIESQKLDLKTELAKKQEAFKRQRSDLEMRSKFISDEYKLTQLKKLQNDMLQKEMQLEEQRRLAQVIASPEGISREEVFALRDKDQQTKAIFFNDGRARFVVDREDAKKIRQEILPDLNSALSDLKALKDFAEVSITSPGDFFKARARAKVLKQALVGKLRLPLFGPGVLTQVEQDIAKSLIGDPTEVSSRIGILQKLEVEKLDTLMKKLKFSARQSLRSSGVLLPKSKNEIKLQEAMDDPRNKGKLKSQIINAMIKTGMWVEEDDLI